MTMLAKVGSAFQQFFGSVAEDAAAQSGVIQRKREFNPVSLAMTFVLAHLWKPQASPADLAKIAMQCGANVSPQAVEQRRTQKLVDFLQLLFRGSLKIVVASSNSLAPLLERFTSVTLGDSSIVTLPDSQQKEFQGCGGNYDSSKAAMKLQTEMDLRNRASAHSAGFWQNG